MSYFQQLPLELTEATLDYLDAFTLRATLRTATFLRHPSEKKLYHRVNLEIDSPSTQGLSDRQARFFDTVFKNDRLASYIVKLEMGGCDPIEGDIRVIRIIGRAMKKMINLKDLYILGYPYIIHAHLDSVPFSLTRLLMMGTAGISETAPDLPLLSILRAHPNLEELAMDCKELPSELVEALKAEQEALPHESGIICPGLKRFDGYDETLRLFFPMRMIESGTAMGSRESEYIEDDELVDVWVTPALISSYRHLHVLEVWPHHSKNPFLPTIAPYLASLTHLHILGNLLAFRRTNDVLLSMGKIPALQSVTLSDAERIWFTPPEAREIMRLVCTICPDIQDIFLQEGDKYGHEGETDAMYYWYTKGEGVHDNLVHQQVACKPYTEWLHE